MSGTFVAGAYTATYNAKASGQAAQGYRISHSFFKRLVTGDLGGDTPQDGIYRGREQFISYELIEAVSAAIPDLVDPYASTLGTPHTMGVIGTLDVGYSGFTGKAKQLILTAVTGSSADDSGPATITFPLSIIAETFPVDVLYAPDLRQVPIRQRIYPNESGVFGTET